MAIITVTESGVVTVGNGDTVIIDIPGGGDVTIVAEPNENIKTFRIEFVDDQQADSVNIELSTFTSDDLHIDIKDYDTTDSISLNGAFNPYVDPNDPDEYEFSYVGLDGETYQGYVRAKDKGEKDFTSDPPPIIICFAAGTDLRTTLGWKRVEELQPWDCLQTRDHGFQPLRWVGHRRLSARELARHAHLRPVVVERGALGPNMPRRRMRLSPQHRVLVSGYRVELNFGHAEALVPIKALIDGVTIYPDPSFAPVDYYHLLLDRHAILDADGCPAESLLMAEQSRRAVHYDDEGWEHFGPEQPELAALSNVPAPPFLTVAEGRLLAARASAPALDRDA